MNRRDQNASSQQPGGYRSESSPYEPSRQANQWQADNPAQTGGSWDSDEDQRSGHWRVNRGQDQDEGRARGFGGSESQGDYVQSNYGQPRSYRPSDDWQGGRGRQDRGNRGYRDDYPIGDFNADYGNNYSSFTSEDFGGRDFSARRGGVGFTGGMHPSESYRPSYGFSRSRSRDDYGDWRSYGEERGFLERAGDEIASWFGDEDAARRREQDHAGRGPSDYTRSDERIREDANDHLTHDRRVDASHVRVTVKNGEVTLDGTVDSRQAKRRAEDVVDSISGVKHVQNNLRVQDRSSTASTQPATTSVGDAIRSTGIGSNTSGTTGTTSSN